MDLRPGLEAVKRRWITSEQFVEVLREEGPILDVLLRHGWINPAQAADLRGDVLGLMRDVLAEEPPPDAPKVGRYRLLRQVGQGGMGAVWEARDPELGRRVAIKIVSSLPGSEEAKRFQREAKAAAALTHPGIVRVYDVGESAQGQFISMEYVDGPTAERADLSPRRALEVARDVAEAAHAAHQAGLIHRDIKPANIMIAPDGRALVLDFGLAKLAKVDSSLSVSGVVAGTPSYMPPEQARGRVHDLDSRADVYALGATLFHLVCGRPPFVGESTYDILEQVIHGEPPRPRLLNPKIHRDVETIILHAMEKDPARRYASAKEFGDDIRRYLEAEPIVARPSGFITRAWKRMRKRRSVLPWAMVVVALLAAAAVLLWRRKPEPWVTVYEDSFDRMELGPAWLSLRGDPPVSIHDGELCSRNGMALLAGQFHGDLVFEFDARVMPDSPDAREISAFVRSTWTGESSPLEAGYGLEFGITDARTNMIQRSRRSVDERSTPRLEGNRRYHMKVELKGPTITYLADDEIVARFSDPTPLGGPAQGRLGFASQCSHLHFDNVRISMPLSVAERHLEINIQEGFHAAVIAALDGLAPIRSSPELRLQRCRSLYALGRTEEADGEARGLFSSTAEMTRAQAVELFAESLARTGRFEEADELVWTTHASVGQAARPLLERASGAVSARAGVRFWEARAERWADYPPAAENALLMLVQLRASSGSTEDFDRAYQRCLRFGGSPYFKAVHESARFLFLLREGEFARALEVCDAVLSIPGDAEDIGRVKAALAPPRILVLACLGRDTREASREARVLIPVRYVSTRALLLEAELVAALLMDPSRAESSYRPLAACLEANRVDVGVTMRDIYALELADEEVRRKQSSVNPEVEFRLGLRAAAKGDFKAALASWRNALSVEHPGPYRAVILKLIERTR